MTEQFDSSLFNLPVGDEPGNAEVPISNRSNSRSKAKSGFWGALSRRINLTGPGSLVSHRPYGVDPEGVLTAATDRIEALADYMEAKAALCFSPEAETGELSLWKKQHHLLRDVTPQFFLRNISRLERDVNVRRPAISYAVWRDDKEINLHFAAVRYPRRETPELIEELSPAWVRRIAREVHANVHDLDWADDVGNRDLPPPRKIHPASLNPPIPLVSVDDLSLDPAPPNRPLPDDRWTAGIKLLRSLKDGSLDDE